MYTMFENLYLNTGLERDDIGVTTILTVILISLGVFVLGSVAAAALLYLI